MKLEIGRREIKEGKRDSPTECPFSLALAKVLRPGVHARVYPHRVDYWSRKSRGVFLLPPDAKDWLERWDRGEKVGAGEFEIWAPTWALRAKRKTERPKHG